MNPSNPDNQEFIQVICDASNNTSDDIDVGRLNVDVVVQPVFSGGECVRIQGTIQNQDVWTEFPDPKMWPY